MDRLEMNTLLARKDVEKQMLGALAAFEAASPSLTASPGIYVCGGPGSGKTEFVQRLLTQAGYELVIYNSSHGRGRSMVEGLASNTLAAQSVLGMMQARGRAPLAIIMDDIDAMAAVD